MQQARDLLIGILNINYMEVKLSPDEDDEVARRGLIATSPETMQDEIITSDIVAAKVSVFPNPAGQEIFVQIKYDFDCELKISTVSGQVLIQNTVKAMQQNKIETSKLDNGIYFVSLFNKNHLLKTTKLIIAK